MRNGEESDRSTWVQRVPEKPEDNTAEIRRAVAVLFGTGSVVELRAFDGRKTASGYFDDHAELVQQALRLEEQGYQVYATLNPVNDALLARSNNKVKQYPKATTGDQDILKRIWFPIDLDPVRPSGISATDEEKQAALLRAREIREFLEGMGWPRPVEGDSGNGAHLLYLLNLPNDKNSLEMVKDVLETLHFKFSDSAVSVDTSTANASRIWKLYGTTARKGDSTLDRPHRRSSLLRVPEHLEVEERIASCGL